MPEASPTAQSLYDLLAKRSAAKGTVRSVILGINWTLATVELTDANGQPMLSAGLTFSPVDVARTLSWPGTLAGQPVENFTSWLMQWEAAEAAVGGAVTNAVINATSPLINLASTLDGEGPPHLRVFEHFLPRLAGKRVVVVGRYPGIERYQQYVRITCLEKRPQPGDFPDSAAEFVLPDADWVFITASSIANKTLPRLLQLSSNATVVLMGPSLPWLEGWRDWGVNYLAGVAIENPEYLERAVAEGGGTRIFQGGVAYKLFAL